MAQQSVIVTEFPILFVWVNPSVKTEIQYHLCPLGYLYSTDHRSHTQVHIKNNMS